MPPPAPTPATGAGETPSGQAPPEGSGPEFPPPNAAAGPVWFAPLPRLQLATAPVELAPGRARRVLAVTNTGDRPIQVGSHYHFFEANRALAFDRAGAFGTRLDIPAGTSVRFEPGDTREITVVELGGARRALGFANLVDGSASTSAASSLVHRAHRRAVDAGFADRPAPDPVRSPDRPTRAGAPEEAR